ncbi:hypothetical protein TSUD_315550 [Trifolium subterraneum]|uniref:Peptidase M41 domain-containing protein n=1 Tax=Trifolium subterraneum TaxID=3900 RepID=A0A2Z6N617_TRISU|nr:hypothetical protein TSUD_315550 [Trifolium subterraneum]
MANVTVVRASKNGSRIMKMDDLLSVMMRSECNSPLISTIVRDLKNGSEVVEMNDMLYVIGSECNSKRKKMSYHEAGHVLVAIHTDGAPHVCLATIIPTVSGGCQQSDTDILSHKKMLV